MMYIQYIQIVAAAYLAFLGAIMDTPNMESKLLFNFFPIGLAILLLIDALKTFGLI